MAGLLRSLAAKLRARFPGIKVSIRSKTLSDDVFAHTFLDESKGVFVIEIDKNLEECFACFILAHEFPHAVSYHIDHREHGPAFWKAQKVAYEVYRKWAES